MPNKPVQAAAEGLPILTRRKALGLFAAAAVPATVGAATKLPTTKQLSPAEMVELQANELVNALQVMHPDRVWRLTTDHEHYFSLFVGDKRKEA